MNVDFHTCAPLPPSPHPFLTSTEIGNQRILGVQRNNIWKLAGQRVTQHFIKHGAVPDRSSLAPSSFLLTNDPEKPGNGSRPTVVRDFIIFHSP